VTEKGWHSVLAAQTILWAELVSTIYSQPGRFNLHLCTVMWRVEH